ncbi:MAG: choice-of-anchor D domain-containing protein, partial [Candidatus Acidiferrales bacterium]
TPAGLAVDRAGNLFVSDAAQNRILRVDAASGRVSLVADHFLSPGDIAFDAAGNLYAADQVRHQIVVIPADGVGCSDAGALSLCPDTFAFTNPNSVPPLPPQPIGGATPPEAFTLTNTSGAQISGVVWSFTGTNPADFAVSSTSCLTSLATGGNCTLNVAFNPGQAATPARSASLSVSDTNPADSVSSTLSGTADDFEIQIPTGQLQSVGVVAGNAAVFKMEVIPDDTFSAPAYTGAPALTIVCPTNLPAFTSCAISSPNLVSGSTNQVTVAAGTPTPFTMTFQTTSTAGTTTPPGSAALALPFLGAPGGNAGGGFASNLAAVAHATHLTPAEMLALALILFFAAIFLGVRGLRAPALSSPRLRLRHLWAPALLLLGAAALTGCHHAIAKSTGTPSGTTNFLVQGTVQNASRGFVVQMVVSQ